MDGGSVRCWGDNGYGHLGYGNTLHVGDNETPASVGNVNVGGTVVALAAGEYHTCALMNGGTLRCWGTNDFGKLGYATGNPVVGDNEHPASMGNVDVGGTVIQVAAGIHHTCARLDDDTVRCWGLNVDGQLGYSNTINIGDNEFPSSVGVVDVGAPVSQLTLGGHTCAMLDGGAVRCWGPNSVGQLGYGHTNRIGDDELPVSAGDVDVGAAVIGLAAGLRHNCALLDGGALRCWGSGVFGQLGYELRTPLAMTSCP